MRRVCENCAEEREITDAEVHELGPSAEAISTYSMGAGCERCRSTGYKGRIGLFELLIVQDELRETFLRSHDQRALEAAAAATGLRTLRDDGIVKIRAGITTPEEVLRVT